jgi:hypothetical protein
MAGPYTIPQYAMGPGYGYGQSMPMQPMVDPQYPGIAGMPTAQATPRGVPAQTGIFDVPNPFENAEGAAIRGLRNLGYNPGSFHPAIRRVVERASALAKELMLSLPELGPDMAGDASAMLGAFTNLIQSGLAGGKVFGGKGAGALERLAGIAQQAEGDLNASPGAKFIAQILASPDSSAALYAQALYGGAPTAFQRAQVPSLATLQDVYQQALEQRGAAAPLNLLDLLLGRQTRASQTNSLGTYNLLYPQRGGPTSAAPLSNAMQTGQLPYLP